jgi:hypothetical protein
MTKNKRKVASVGLTSQGVRDLNNIGPRRPRASDATIGEREVALRGGSPIVGSSTHYGLPQGFGREGDES